MPKEKIKYFAKKNENYRLARLTQSKRIGMACTCWS